MDRGGDLNPGLKRYALTPLKCRELCAADAECELFTVNMRSRRCHFKVRHAPRTLMQRACPWTITAQAGTPNRLRRPSHENSR